MIGTFKFTHLPTHIWNVLTESIKIRMTVLSNFPARISECLLEEWTTERTIESSGDKSIYSTSVEQALCVRYLAMAWETKINKILFLAQDLIA